MGQKVDEHNLLDKKESEDYHYVKEVKKNPEPDSGSRNALLHPRRDGLCSGKACNGIYRVSKYNV